ncbi:hypothetical protein K501DRAFT_181045 [Backusella circina FSU 941]|nr:hypothetical protein K501DRAFT_181045 [Backusella circina FSU 941]
MKRKKLPPMNVQATPSEVFHRNLVDAVSNVEDSDENEQYVYPYSGNNTDTSYHLNPSDTLHRTTSSLYRPQSTRSFAQHQQSSEQSPKKSFLGDFLRPILFKSKSDSRAIMSSRQDEESTTPTASSRPKLRNFVMDHSYSQFKVLTSDWSDGKSSPPHRSSRRKIYPHYDGGYTTDDEEAHLLTPSRRYKQVATPKKSYSRIVKNVFICLFLAIIVLFICVVYLAKPLTELTVDMGRVLSSDKELIFDLHISAINSNFWSVHVADADISVFAFSQVVPMSLNRVDPAEYLGGFYRFDEPLSFPSSFYSHDKVTAISQIRIKSPGADKSGNERWSRIIRYPYGLVVRGVLKYRPLPFASPYPQSVAICDVVRVDPTTGKVSEDPDQGYCLSYGHRSYNNLSS